MGTSISRPDDAVIRKYMMGESSEAESAAVEAYLESSPDLTPLPVPLADDTLLSCLRGQADVTPMESPRLKRAMDWLKKIGIEPDPNAVTNPSNVVEEKAVDDSDDELLRLLGKSDASGGFGELGGYKILRVLGRGGMGVVVEAEDAKLGRRIALKAMRPTIANSSISKQRFIREAIAAAKVEHDHIVPIYQVGEDRGILFLAMPFLKGEPLDARLKREQKLPAIEVARVGRQVSEGLAAAHEAGLVHRDIKPANLWLETTPGRIGTNYRVKILDFGLARLEGPQDIQITGSGTLLGTPAYMAPEQANGQQVDARADLFSLGVVLYRAATGALPFKGETPLAILSSLAVETPTNASKVNRELPTPIGDLIARLLEKDPTKRPASAREVAKAFRDIQSDLAGDTVPVAAAVKPIVAPLDPWNDIDEDRAATPTPAPTFAKGPRKPRKKLLVAAGLLGLAAAIAVVIVIFKDKDGKEVARVNVPEGGSFEIKDDGKRKTDPKKDGPKPVMDADRKAAEWFVNNHAAIKVECEGQAINEIRAADKLPKRPFTIRSIWLLPKTTLDGALENLRQLTGVEQLNLEQMGIPDAWLAQLASVPGIAQSLKIINLNGSQLTDAGVLRLKRFSKLHSIILYSPTLSDKSLAAFDGMKLQSLNIAGLGITDAGMEHLRGCADLNLLYLFKTSVGDAGLIRLKALPALVSLGLTGGKFTDQCLKTLAEYPKLNQLALNDVSITDQSLAVLKDCKSLTKLYILKCKVTDAGLSHLTNMPLDELNLSQCAIGDAGLETIAKLKSLGIVTLNETKATEAGVKRLAAALPKCTIYSDHGTFTPISPDRLAAEWVLSIGGILGVNENGNEREIKAAVDLPRGKIELIAVTLLGNAQAIDAGPAWLKDCKNLKRLALQQTQVSAAGMSRFKDCTGLTHLALQSTTLSSDAGLALFKDCKNLAHLVLNGQVSDAGLANFKDNKNLTGLNLAGTEVSDMGLAHFKECANLTSLYLSKTKVGDGGLAHFKDCKNIAHLYLAETKLTDAGLAHFKNCKLNFLDVRKTSVTAAKIDELTKVQPQCKIEWDGGTIEPLPQSERERRIAEWLLKRGGNITVEFDGKAVVPKIGMLPDQPFKITRIINGNTEFAELAKQFDLLDGLKDLNLGDLPLSNADLLRLASTPSIANSLESLELVASRISDGGLAAIKKLRVLRHLSLIEDSITDAGVKYLREMPQLQSVFVRSPLITDTGVRELRGLKLSKLALASPAFTDAGAEVLKDFPDLGWLWVRSASMTDAGLEHLSHLKKLEYLNITKTKVTDAGVKKLAAALSSCKIEWDGGTIEPKQPGLSPDKEKPFVLIRDGKSVSEFKSFAGIRAELAAGDEIVVHGNGPFELPRILLDGIGLTIKAAPGYRPRFRPSANVDGTWIGIAKFPLRLEGCDFVSDKVNVPLIVTGGDCDIDGCRLVTAYGNSHVFVLQANGKRARVRNSMMVSSFCGSAVIVGPKTSLEFENNVIANGGWQFFAIAAPGGQTVTLTHNTIIGTANLFHLNPGCVDPITLMVKFNLIDGIHNALLVCPDRNPGNLKDLVRWTGRDNRRTCEIPPMYIAFDNAKDHITKLENWQKLWGDADQGRREAKGRPFQFDLAWAGKSDAERLAAMKQIIQAARPMPMKDAGPVWDQIGPGDAYLNALAAAGKPVPKEQLRPEALEGGPVVLLRNGKALFGYKDVNAAVEAAADGDVIELRTDMELPTVARFGANCKPKVLTLRAAPGYRPVMSGLNLDAEDVWAIEGIHFKVMINDQRTPTAGQVVRLANCSFADTPEASNLVMCINGRGKAKTIGVVNCMIPTPIWLSNMTPGTRIVVQNSIIWHYFSHLDNCQGDQHIDLDHCVAWQPARPTAVFGFNSPKDVLAVDAKGCWFETGKLWSNIPRGRIKWSGNRNVYRIGNEIWCIEPARKDGLGTVRLDQWQKDWSSDANSVALDPLHYDPAQWKLRSGAPGQGTGPNGKDLGADVSKVAVSVSSDLDHQAAEWVLSIGGKIDLLHNPNWREVAALKDFPGGPYEFVGVRFDDNNRVTDAGLDNLKGFTKPLAVHLNNTAVTSAGLERLKALSNLKNLEFPNHKLDDAGVAHIQAMSNLEWLVLSGVGLNDSQLAKLQTLKALANLHVHYNGITDAGLAHLQGFPNLSGLLLQANPITDNGLAHLNALTRLRSLHLASNSLTDAGLKHLYAMGNLAEINLTKTKVTAEGVAALHKALPGCKIVWDGGTIEPVPQSERERKAAEWVLSIGGDLAISPWQPIAQLKDLPAGPFSVQSVNFTDNKKVDDAGLLHLKGLAELRTLFLYRTAITDAGLMHIKDLPKLETLYLHGTRITDAGVAAIKTLPNLKGLGLDYTEATDAALVRVEAMTNLESLHIGSSNISEKGLLQFKAPPKLRYLGISLPLNDRVAAWLKGLPNLTALGITHQPNDDCLAHLKALPNLRELSLDSGAGLVHLKDCKSLAQLDLRNTRLSDADLKVLNGLTKLTGLDVRGTKLTADGVKKLSAALPLCKIEWDGGTIEPKK